MKSKQEIRSMLLVRLAELQDGRIKKSNPAFAEQLRIELALLYQILEEDMIEEGFAEQIEEEI